MNVTIFGTGYVGLVTGTCLADSGHRVCCVDIDQEKIDRLNGGEIPIYEPGLSSLVSKNVDAGRLRFTTDAADAVDYAEVIFIAVGTPPDQDGSADLSYVLAVAAQVGELMKQPKIVLNKSTVPVGTADLVSDAIGEALQQRGMALDYQVASNPEFLKEGNAVADFMKPDRIIVGTESDWVRKQMTELYAPFNRMRDKLVFMDPRSAEMTKYAANAMLATKISFMNEMANLAEHLGADIELVRQGIGSDPRIGYHFIYPGCGYGGSCFPKDVQAIERMAQKVGYEAQLIGAVEAVNQRQKSKLFERISNHFNGDLKGRTFALWGLAFKPNTDDMREAPSRVLMEKLWQAGARVRAYDPEAMAETRRIYGDREDLALCDSQDEALEGADGLVICTEWSSFRTPDFDMLHQRLTETLIFDGRNLFDPQQMSDQGFTYYGMGRGRSLGGFKRG
ncbi:UDP-glucose/GDP-mannose dehydrogenase family protein [Motiliproteus coralliicola]|uniref:UDP-glucose 6-dehydrogenase n=1 Tax=Motiliproteus coralliicola TaxID=2283196 RepID=A0A369WMM9_9GAMM|nr:UDP-glucose/GDP-mannose dehydrogenase family protein [Motiliproteus coralliicola]RDE22972.1 UDP-glucose/GDP-mannose dehydrogenase family protein [Motiliproteus coralliicola]